MKRSRLLRECVAVLVTALLIAGIFATGVLDRQKVFTEMTYHDILVFDKAHPGMFDRATYSIEDGDSYGIHNSGPGYDLIGGRYKLKYRVAADGENIIRISSRNNAEIVPSEIGIDPDQWEQETWIEIREDAVDVQIQFEFASGTTMRVDDLRLYTPDYRDDAYTASLILAAMCVLFILYGRGRLTNQDIGGMILIGLAVVVASAPSFKENMILCHDSTFHMARIMNLADGLEHMQFPVRLGGFTHNGYGAVTSVFYADLLLVPFAMMINGGASITYVMNLINVVVNIVAAISMYACARRIFGSRETGVCASILYTLSTYRVLNLYSRGALGEMWGMSLLPLFVLGMWEVIFGDRESWPLLAVSAALIYLSHLITAALCGLAAVMICALCAGRILREHRFISLVKAVLTALLLGMYTMIPFLMYSAQGIGAQAILGANTLHMLSPAQLFLWGRGDMAAVPKDTQLSSQAFEIGIPMLMGVAALLYMRAVRPQKDQKERHALFFAGAGLVSAFMTTTLFPWNHLAVLTAGYSNYLQFPWRLLLVTSPMLSLACGYAFMRLAGEKKELVTFAVLGLSLVMVLPTISEEARKDDYLQFGEAASPYIEYVEYMIPGSSIYDTFDRTLHTEGDVRVTDYVKDSTTVTADVDAATDALLSLPLFGYDGYRATVDGEEMQWTLGENNRLTVHIPAGMQGELRVWFAGKTAWRIADCVSLATAALLGVFALRRRKVKKVNM